MTPDQIIWTMIKDLLTEYYEYYDEDNIIMSFQNNYTLPTIDDFIIITRRNVFQNGMPLRDFDIENQKKVLTGFNDWEYQIDLYGDNSDLAANVLYTYLNSSAASNYLYFNEMGIGKLSEARNLTRENDRDRYMKRYMVLFTAMNIGIVSVPMAGIALEDIEITYEEFT